jgi:uncharacterized protein
MSILKPVALITGASAGIGAELAQVFADNGHEMMLVARREPRLAAVAERIAAAGRPRPYTYAVDLARPDAPARVSDELLRLGLEPQFVVNNAGFGLMGHAAELDRDAQLALVDVNMRALTDLSLRFIDSLVRRQGGILNVASVLGFMPGPGMAVYHASKAYVISFSEALHSELAPQGVRVSVLCPGPVNTEFGVRADGLLSRLLIRAPDRVAREGYAGLMAGRRMIVPGFDNKVLHLLPRLLPRSLILSMVGASKRRHLDLGSS